ncbi:serine protease [Sphingomonas sanguinis]|uniref:trypsin-like serine peptidase n=1 Tax=Sphingomonas sanguinis TaxID=33051 RepID=UPI001C59CC8F|nr:serine protease [Sphingomonas sanguinis]QXT34877.1 serine protease [Sphingomonas sanguinis]
MTQPTDDEIAGLASGVILARGDYERVFNEARGGRSLPFKVLALMAPGRSAVEVTMLRARDDGWFGDLAERLSVAGAFADPDPEDAKPAAHVQLQGIVDERLGMLVQEKMHRGGIAARKRVCRISLATDPPVHGTGFLVGPQAVLTARHVVERLLGGDGQPARGSDRLISVNFDAVGRYNRPMVCGVMTQWLIASSPKHDAEDTGSSASALDLLDADEFRDRLDYAVLRLDRVVGRERGFYSLGASRVPCVDAERSAINLYQHPAGDVMHYAAGFGQSLWPGTVRTRLRHTAASIPGSSGGLIVDRAFEVVAMHQCTFLDDDGKPLVNGAIPTASIAARRDKVENVVGVLDPVWRIPVTGEPVVGRDGFQSAVNAMLTGPARIVCVRGAVDADLAFTKVLLRGLLDEVSNLIVTFSAADLPLDAPRLANVLLERTAGAGSTYGLPQLQEADTALEAWLRDHLVPGLISALRAAAGNRTLWLVVEDLDAHPIREGTAARLLERLYAEVGAGDFMRLVLVGQRSLPLGAQPGAVIFDDVPAFDRAAVTDYVARRSTELDEDRDMAELEREARLILNAAKAKPMPLARAIAVAISEVYAQSEPLQ